MIAATIRGFKSGERYSPEPTISGSGSRVVAGERYIARPTYDNALFSYRRHAAADAVNVKE